jgi:hypothetical protein
MMMMMMMMMMMSHRDARAHQPQWSVTLAKASAFHRSDGSIPYSGGDLMMTMMMMMMMMMMTTTPPRALTSTHEHTNSQWSVTLDKASAFHRFDSSISRAVTLPTLSRESGFISYATLVDLMRVYVDLMLMPLGLDYSLMIVVLGF